VKITRRQLRRIIREDLIRSLDEARYTAGVRAGDVVWLKDDPDRGKGVVRGKYKHPQQGHLVQVQWERTGDSSLHIPSAITTSQETASKWSSGRIAPQARRPWNDDPDDDSDDPQELGNMMADGDIYTNLVKFVARWFADDEEQANDFIQDMIKLGVDDAFLNSNLEPDSEYEIRSMLQTGGWMHAGDVFTGSQLPPDKLEQ